MTESTENEITASGMLCRKKLRVEKEKKSLITTWRETLLSFFPFFPSFIFFCIFLPFFLSSFSFLFRISFLLKFSKETKTIINFKENNNKSKITFHAIKPTLCYIWLSCKQPPLRFIITSVLNIDIYKIYNICIF